MIYDCFTFWNETEILELRLGLLYNFVDYFVICESLDSHSKKIRKNEYILEKNKNLYDKYWDKIIYLKIDKLEFDGDSGYDISGNKTVHWKNENYQRCYLYNGFKNANDDDIIAISDLDEIWNPQIIPVLRTIIDKHKYVGCIMNLFYYYVNTLKLQPWKGTYLTYKKNIIENKYIQLLRNSRERLPVYLNNSGWHYSWMGKIDKIREKFLCIAEHDLIDEHNNIENISNCVNNITDLFNRKGRLGEISVVELNNSNSPPNIFAFIKKYPYLEYKSIPSSNEVKENAENEKI